MPLKAAPQSMKKLDRAATARERLRQPVGLPLPDGRGSDFCYFCGSCEEIGRASLPANHRPSQSLPHEARREPRPPDLPGFEVSHSFRVRRSFPFIPFPCAKD